MHTRKLLMTVEEEHVWTYLLEEDRIVEIYVASVSTDETERSMPALGNIYVGKVQNIVSNIVAAFIEIQPGVCCYYDVSQADRAFFTNKNGKKPLCIGDELIVQINKEAVKSKAPTVTTNFSITGRYAVLTHGNTRIGASNKLSKQLKESLKERLSGLKNENFGIIVRTNAGEVPFSTVLMEIEELRGEYDHLLDIAKSRTCFSCLKSAPPSYITALKNVYIEGLEEIVIEDEKLYKRVLHFFETQQPEILNRIKLYKDSLLPLAKLYNVHRVIERALGEHVWLKSGGYLVIQPTEALTVIDVNSGKYTAKKKRKDAGLQINLEAAKEAAYQIRLRNLSGIIVIDFINLDSEQEMQILLKELKKYLEEDPVQTTLVDVTPLQLVEITRKKVRKPLHEVINKRKAKDVYKNTIIRSADCEQERS